MSCCSAETSSGELLPKLSAASKATASTAAECPHPECPIPGIVGGNRTLCQPPKELALQVSSPIDKPSVPECRFHDTKVKLCVALKSLIEH